jgi:hypothetical protein
MGSQPVFQSEYLIDRLSLRDGAIAKSPGTSDIGGTGDVLYGYIADPG